MEALKGYPFLKGNSIKITDSKHLKAVHIYSFKNRKKTKYIVNIEEYRHDVYAVKFFKKSHAHSANKYNLLTHQHDARNVIYTCINIAFLVYKKNPCASFGFIGAPIMQEKLESRIKNNKRYRVYKLFAAFFFNPDNFKHFPNPTHSAYLLLNKKKMDENLNLETEVLVMFQEHFEDGQFENV